jgi:hypothetical protein
LGFSNSFFCLRENFGFLPLKILFQTSGAKFEMAVEDYRKPYLDSARHRSCWEEGGQNLQNSVDIRLGPNHRANSLEKNKKTADLRPFQTFISSSKK